MALYNCLSFVKFTAGMLIGLVTVVLLAEKQAAIRSGAPCRILHESQEQERRAQRD
jgi:hypothetical protein